MRSQSASVPSDGGDGNCDLGGSGWERWGPEVRDGAGVPTESVPRPYLHPVRTLRGTLLTDAAPEDHPWHLGLGFAVPDVDGTNCWGGGTYVHGEGYALRGDHGAQRLDGIDRHDGDGPSADGTNAHRTGGITMHITWLDRHGTPLLGERRNIRWNVIDDTTWRLDLRTELSTDQPRVLATPGTHGRQGAGYGGWFWRMAPCSAVEVRTPTASGEGAVHGSVAPWLAWTATFGTTTGSDGGSGTDATVVALPSDDATAADPWFVRITDYPAFGSALAWSVPTTIRPDTPFVRSLRIGIADGRVDPAALADALRP